MTDDKNLLVELIVPDVVTAGEPCKVTASVTAIGLDPVVVNRRLAVGYEDNLSRELFLTIITAEGFATEVDRVDYERDWPVADDFVTLSTGGRVSTDFNLLDWYPLPPGRYEIVTHYQADEPLAVAALEAAATPGQHASEPVTLEVQPE